MQKIFLKILLGLVGVSFYAKNFFEDSSGVGRSEFLCKKNKSRDSSGVINT
jgi:hypothetical protein